MSPRADTNQLEKIHSELCHIGQTLVRQEAQLAEHMRRTELLEQELRPIKTHVAQVNGALKLIGLMSLLAGIASAIIGLW